MRKPRPAPRPETASTRTTAATATATTGSLLGEWIRKARLEQEISQRALADRAGLSRSYVCDIERGRGAEPSMTTLDKLASALGVSRADLMAAAGLIDKSAGGRETDDERRILTIFRDLSENGQATAMRFVRFLQAEEQRWTQPQLLGGGVGTADGVPERAHQDGPMLFDLND